MEERPLIGIPTQTLHAIDGIPDGLPSSWVMNRRYYDAVAYVGGVPLMVPLFDDDEATLRAIFDRLDGVFLAGGVDLDPDSYAAARHDRLGRTDPARDRVEILLARWAIAEGKPLLGVCRGMQVLNVAAGGTLYQDCEACVPDSIKHDYFPTAGHARDYLAHDVRLVAGSRLRRAFAAADASVNSMHHQGIDRIGDGLAPTAYAPDGLVEAVESVGDAFIVGVQWHPEMLIEADPGTRRLFEEFVEAAMQWRRIRVLVAQTG